MAYSANEKHQLIQYLDTTRDNLLAAVKGLSEAQLSFHTSPGCWSIAGIVEHVAMVEEAVITTVLQERPSTSIPDRKIVNETDAGLLRKATDRSAKLEAPGQFHPTGKPMAVSLEQFLSGRKKIVDCIQSTHLDLRHIVTQTRAFGPLDGHQRLLFLAAHSSRHTDQILETKSNPIFPTQ